MAVAPVFIANSNLGLAQVLPADTTTVKTILTGNTNGTKVSGLMITSTDSASRIVQLSVTRSATVYYIGAVTVPALSGTDGTAVAINMLSSSYCPGLPVDNDGAPYLFLNTSDILGFNSTTTITAAKVISAAAISGNF